MPADFNHAGAPSKLHYHFILSPQHICYIICQAQAFAREWMEVRPLYRTRLHHQPLSLPLDKYVDMLTTRALASGAYGLGLQRNVRLTGSVPKGARLRSVQVRNRKTGAILTYEQAFDSQRRRLCLDCMKRVSGEKADPSELLDGTMELFCGGDCESRFFIRSQRDAIRRELFAVERGVCAVCQLDCHALVQRLRAIDRNQPGYKDRRHALLHKLAAGKPLLSASKVLLDKVLKEATEGTLWHADHVLPVYKGGGGCDLDNLRTLCIACHAKVTRQQARERAAERRRRKLGVADIEKILGKV